MSYSHSHSFRPYVKLGFLRGLFDYLHCKKISLDPLLEVMSLSQQELRDPDTHIDNTLQNEIFDTAETLTRDPDIGLHAGETTHLIHFGIVGQLAMTSKTGRELLQLHSRFQRLISTGKKVTYQESDGIVIGDVTVEEGARLSRHVTEYSLASHIMLIRLISNAPISPIRLDLPYPQPTDDSEQQRFFNCAIHYDCQQERLYFPARLLDAPMTIRDSASRESLEIEARRRLVEGYLSLSDLVDEYPRIASLKGFIADHLKAGEPPSVKATALALGMSVRTLQRRLEMLRLNYRELIDLVRRELADEYIRDSKLSHNDITLLLGYSEESAFYRAFRRWFEMTPGEYRSLRPEQ